ncbi:unnamed protein product [Brachionus calyciflorus]|uniref:Retrotransposon gag domain-containing protein n=1 Tax=Brachionus calyciflorus TaxID=104777 RepID=A0A814KM36_9BILA|nr:unnamed protein product [Brachionus calyciflorus]
MSQPKTEAVSDAKNLQNKYNCSEVEDKSAFKKELNNLKKDQLVEMVYDDINTNDSAQKYTRIQFKLDSSIPVLDQRVDLEDWIFRVECSVKGLSVPESLILSSIYPFLRGLAAQTLKKFTDERGNRANWNDFKEMLYVNLRHPDYKNRLRTQLKELKQGGNYEKYVKKFTYIIYKLDFISEEDKIFWFVQGLNNETKYEVKIKNC